MKSKKQARRTAARATAAGKLEEGYHRPGSGNPHKTFPLNTGRRSFDKVQADSRKATSR